MTNASESDSSSKPVAETDETWVRLCAQFENDIELIRELVEIFEPDLKDHLAQLRRAVRNDSPAEVERIAHSLRGAVANFDDPFHINLLLELEQRGREGDLSGVSAQLAQIDSGLRELVSKLRSHLP